MITLSQPQSFQPTPSNGSIYQNWGPTNAILNLYYNPTAGLIPNPFAIDFKLKDVVNTALADIYNSFRFYVTHPVTPSSPNWLTNDALPASGVFTPITEAAISIYTNFNFENLNLLTTGNYQYKFLFKIQGENDLGNFVDVATYQYTINLAVTNDVVSFTPSTLNFNYFPNTPLPSQIVTMNGSNWTLVASILTANGAHLELSSSDPGVTFGTDIFNGQEIQYAQGSGTKEISVALTDYYDGTIEPQYLSGSMGVLAGTTIISGIPFEINILSVPDLVPSPNVLDFFGIVSIQEPVPAVVNVACPSPISEVTHSPWLEVSNVGNQYTVTPISTNSMSAADYVGFVKFKATINSVVVEKSVVVNYKLLNFLSNPYANGRKAFTLDVDFFECFTATAATYFQINAELKIFDFFATTFKTVLIPLKIVPFQGKAKFNIGQNIHRLMSRFTVPTEALFQYKIANLNLNVQEKRISDDSLVREKTLPNINYVAGIGSENTTGLEILAFNNKPTSVKKNSIHYLNMLVKAGTYALHIFKNGTLDSSELLPNANDFILQKKISFQDYNQGDLIKVVLSVPDPTIEIAFPQEKIFYIVPDGPQSNLIEWENEFLLLDAINCTGEYSIKTELEVQENKLYSNLVERLEHISNTSSIKLAINTGWLIKNDVDTIESLMRSKRIWLTAEDSKIELRPATKTLLKQDTQRELIEFTLEFTINKSSNEKTYTF
ncbi:hypothetical protein [Flavobacterium sp.]|uniref:hypothetical protein n=1 Tax=Flavobacterium sp. TaxID=239 RepID=UPI00260CBE5E|nr:hypothetical protein [Flavobacterium sp.]